MKTYVPWAIRVSLLLILCPTAFSGEFTAFEPQDFVRSTGRPVVETASFDLLDPNTQYTMLVHSGGIDGNHGAVSSAVITLNGEEIFSSRDFDNSRQVLSATITPGTSNEIAVELRGSPNDGLTIVVIGIDDTPPTISALLSPLANEAGWNNGAVTVSFVCDDQTSGVASCTAPIPFSDEGVFNVTGTVIDNAGNEASAVVAVRIDTTPPVVVASFSPEANGAGWNNSQVVISFDCVDNFSGVSNCPQTVVLNEEGLHDLSGGVTDQAGNLGTYSALAQIDTTPPVMTVQTQPEANENGWQNSDVLVSFSATDNLSGVDGVSEAQTIGGEGRGLAYTGSAFDLAGNPASFEGSVDIDRTPPSLQIGSPLAGTVFTESTIQVSGSVHELNGIDEVTVNNGPAQLTEDAFSANLNLSQPLSEIMVRVIDQAGNSAQTQVDVFFGRPDVPIIDAPPPFTSATSIIITGTAIGADSVEITTPTGILSVPVANDRFSTDLPLTQNRINRFFATGVSELGPRGAPVSFLTRQDNQPPQLFVDVPADGGQTTAETTDVAGRVGDAITGFSGLSVTVNGIAAVVDVGVGPNGTFFAPAVPVAASGDTLIEVVATDVLGNAVTRQLTIRRQTIPPGSATIEVVSGNAQSAQIGSPLPQPLVVRVLDGNGSPFANKLVTFQISRSDGQIADAMDDPGALSLQVRTDNSGQAQVFWRMGGDSGCGNNRLSALSADVVGEAAFCATALAASASQINVSMGNNQRGESGAPLAEALRVWVSDGRNGIPDVPITFTVIQGDASFDGSDSLTVLSGLTGHVGAVLEMGDTGGNVAVEASFPENQSQPASFVAFSVKTSPEQPTQFKGLVIDNASRPVVGVAMRLSVNGVDVGEEVLTNSDGAFLFSDIPAGPAALSVHGDVATAIGDVAIPPGSFPNLHYETVVVANAMNSLPTEVLLPPLNAENQVLFDNTMDVALTVEGVDGLRMIVRAGSMTLVDGSIPSADNPVTLALNQVHHDDIPMPMPDGAAPPFAWTLQPSGAQFDPPVEIRYPNMSGLPAGSIAYFLSFNHDAGMFEIVATGSVTEDGLSIETDPGAGISTAGWGCNCPPYSVTGECCLENRSCEDNGNLSGGDVSADNDMPMVGDTITFTASGVTDSGGTAKVECPGGQEGTTTESIPAASIEYEYTLTTPDGTTSGSGSTATATAMKCGEYSVSFTAMVDRECAPSSITVGSESVMVEAATIASLMVADGARMASGSGAILEVVSDTTVNLKVTKDDNSKEWVTDYPKWSGDMDQMGEDVNEEFNAPFSDPSPGALIVGPPQVHNVTVEDGCGGPSMNATIKAYPTGEKGFQWDFGDTGDAVKNALGAVPVFGSQLRSAVQFPNGVVMFSNKWEELDDPTVIWAFSANAGVDPLIGWSGNITLFGPPDFIIEVLGGANLNLLLGGKISLVGTIQRNKDFPSGSGGVTLSGGLTGGLQVQGSLPAGIVVISLGATTGISGSGSLLYDVAGNDLVLKPKLEMGGLKVELKYTVLGIFESTDTWMPIEGLTIYDPGKIIIADGPSN